MGFLDNEVWERVTVIVCPTHGNEVFRASTIMFSPKPAQTVTVKKTGSCKFCREYDNFMNEEYLRQIDYEERVMDSCTNYGLDP